MNRRDFIKKTSLTISSISLFPTIGHAASELAGNSSPEIIEIFNQLDKKILSTCFVNGLKSYSQLDQIWINPYVVDKTEVHAWWKNGNGNYCRPESFNLWTSSKEKLEIEKMFEMKYQTKINLFKTETMFSTKQFKNSYLYRKIKSNPTNLDGLISRNSSRWRNKICISTIRNRQIVGTSYTPMENFDYFCEKLLPSEMAEDKYVYLV